MNFAYVKPIRAKMGIHYVESRGMNVQKWGEIPRIFGRGREKITMREKRCDTGKLAYYK